MSPSVRPRTCRTARDVSHVTHVPPLSERLTELEVRKQTKSQLADDATHTSRRPYARQQTTLRAPTDDHNTGRRAVHHLFPLCPVAGRRGRGLPWLADGCSMSSGREVRVVRGGGGATASVLLLPVSVSTQLAVGLGRAWSEDAADDTPTQAEGRRLLAAFKQTTVERRWGRRQQQRDVVASFAHEL